MRLLGALLIAGGAFGLFCSFQMETTVEVPVETVTVAGQSYVLDTERVHNVPLADARRNYLLMSSAGLVAGVILGGAGEIQAAIAKRGIPE